MKSRRLSVCRPETESSGCLLRVAGLLTANPLGTGAFFSEFLILSRAQLRFLLLPEPFPGH